MASHTDFSPLAKLQPFDPNADIGFIGNYAWADSDPDFEAEQAERTIKCTTEGCTCPAHDSNDDSDSDESDDAPATSKVVTQDSFTIEFGKSVLSGFIRSIDVMHDGNQVATLEKVVDGRPTTWFLVCDSLKPTTKMLSDYTTTAKKQATRIMQAHLYAMHQGMVLAERIAARKAQQQS